MNVLAVGAHFDDVDLGCAGALARHVKKGDNVFVYVATNSQYSNPDGVLIRDGNAAAREGEKSAEIIGATLLKGEIPSLYLEFEEKINAHLTDIVEKRKIDIIYTHWTGDIQHDHINLGRATIHAGRHVPCILMYRSNWYQAEVPFQENLYVDITETWELKERAIKAYETEFSRIGVSWIEYFKAQAISNGYKMGVRYAEGFQVVKWLV